MERKFGPHMEQKRNTLRFFRQRLVAVLPRGVGIEREVELIDPAVFEERVVASFIPLPSLPNPSIASHLF